MNQKQEKWNLSIFDQDKVNSLSQELNIKPLLTKVLLSKNLLDNKTESIKQIIYPDDSLINDISELSDKENIQNACVRLKKAYTNKEKIMINGDPDADGISGTTIYAAAFQYLGIKYDYDFPIRTKEGHGLQIRIIDKAKRDGISLIITTDCGSKDYEAINYAKSQGIDVIITDHHVLGKEANPALALINPYTINHPTLFQKLSGGGVALKFVMTFFNFINKKLPSHLSDFMLIITTFGTISDRMCLLNPMNRALIKKGVSCLKQTQHEGLKAITKISFDRNQEINARNLSRTIIPRLNAPGRIGNPEEGILDSKVVVELLLTGEGQENKSKASKLLEILSSINPKEKEEKTSQEKALNTANSIDNINEKRKFITSKIEEEIDGLIKRQVNIKEDKVIIVQGKDWNAGVIGIDTDRLKERFLKPAIILTEISGNDYLKASVRSIPNINIYKILDQCEEIFIKKHNRKLFCMEIETTQGPTKVTAFGGHSQACGFSIHKDDIAELRSLLKSIMSELKDTDYSYTYNIIDKISLAHIGPKLYESLEQLAPYGQNFEFPIYYSQSCLIQGGKPFGNRYQTTRKAHIRFKVYQKSRRLKKTIAQFNAVGFGLSEKFYNLKANKNSNNLYDVIFYIEKDTFKKNNRTEIVLNVLDIRPSGKTVDSFNKPTNEITDDTNSSDQNIN